MSVPSVMLPILGEGLSTLWQAKAFFDYTIEVGEEQFKVHKLIMVSVSDFFKAMLMGDMVESREDRVRLVGQNPEAVSNMLEFIYTGQFGATLVSTEELLACSIYLQIRPAIDICCQKLCDEVSAHNCIDTLAVFRAFSLEDCIEYTTNYIRRNIDEILNVCSFDIMPRDKLQILIECWGKSEWNLFLNIKKRVDVGSENHDDHLNDLMSCVRFALMTPEQLQAVKDMDIYSDSEGAWRELVDKAEEYHALPIHLKVIDKSEQCTVRADHTPLCFASEEYSDGEFHAVEGKSWIKHMAINHPEVGYFTLDSVVVNNFLIACKDQKLHVFDPRNKKWSSLTKMPVAKLGFGIVHYEKHLYIIGIHLKEKAVFNDGIQRYDLETNEWSIISSEMPRVPKGFSACALDGCIYVAGGYKVIAKGFISDNLKHSTKMHCFDPRTSTWSTKAPIPETFKGFDIHMMELFREEVIFVMDSGFYMQYYSPTTDQWSAYDPMCGAYTDLVFGWTQYGLLPSRNRIFFINLEREKRYSRGEEREYDSEPYGTTAGACELWSMREKGKKATVKKLANFPLKVYDEDGEPTRYFLSELALVPQ